MMVVRLSTRILMGTITLVVVMGALTAAITWKLSYDRIVLDMDARGRAISKRLANDVVGPLLTENDVELRLLVSDTRRLNPDVAYTFVIDGEQRVRAHTFEGGFPSQLKFVNIPAGGDDYRKELVPTDGGSFYDFAVPVMDGDLGAVHVGMSEAAMRQEAMHVARGNMAVAAAVLGVVIAGAIIFAAFITRPLKELTRVAEITGSGHWACLVPHTVNDEIGRLSLTFNRMINGLAQAETERLLIEAALRSSEKRLERQNLDLQRQDKIKDGLIRDVSHELKAPVAKQAMMLEVLQRTLESRGDGPEAGNILRVMSDTIKRQEEVINGILDLFRLEAGGKPQKREEIRLDELLNGVIEDYREMFAAQNVALAADLPRVTVRSDGQMLSHVFSNLLDNALKFMRKGVRGEIRVSLSRNNGLAEIRVADNGIGMRPEELRKAFERFYRAAPSVQGSGVGLSICKTIIDRLGGEIRLESDGPGRGTTVVVRLPVSA